MSDATATRVDELGDIFVSVTGSDTVTESQEEPQGDREVPDEDVDVTDGLEDAVEGAEVDAVDDPVE